MSCRSTRGGPGFSYVEVLVATLVLAVSLVPALEALQTAMLGATVNESLELRHQRLTSRMAEMLVEPFGDLEAEEAAAGGAPSPQYSDPPATPDRRLVLLSRYDGDNADNDNDPLTGTDDGLLRLRVELENTPDVLEALVAR